ncbi:MAG TPA: Na+/H+ antiporter [Candidatus Limnocylindria bacterium]|nr:Na+/H+ antiporter [Candidatus Limnocylindria bacterium]
MHEFEAVLLLLGAVAVLALLARRLGISYPFLMVIGGLALGLVPGLPRFELAPEIVLVIFLPPILFAAAFFTSVREFRRNIRPITLLAFGLVLTTTAVVAVVAHALIPGMPWAAAFALGAIVSPPDAIAVTALAQRLGMPRRLVTILEGESLVNDATALVAYRFAVAAVGGGFVPGEAAISFVSVAAGGLFIGAVVGAAVAWLLARIADPPVEVLLSLLAPFAAYLPAESVDASGVLATVTAGMILGWRAPRILAPDARVLASATWQMVLFAVEGLAFTLIGLQLPLALESMEDRSLVELLWLAAAISATVILVRLAWVFPATYVPRWIVPGLARRDPPPPRSAVLVLGWSGMRGAVSLAAALALPLVANDGQPFPHRDLILFLAFAVIIVTLLGQGLTLPWLIRRFGLGDDGSSADEERHAREAATAAALDRLEQLRAEWPDHEPLIDQLRDRYLHRQEHLSHHEDVDGTPIDQEAAEHAEIRQAVLGAERLAVIDLRDRGLITDDALRRVERDIDLEELRSEA